jgi:hypothetical protein
MDLTLDLPMDLDVDLAEDLERSGQAIAAAGAILKRFTPASASGPVASVEPLAPLPA